MSVLQVNGLTVSYADSDGPVVRDLGFVVEAGEAVGIVGESGAGKSQTALAIMGLSPANARVSGSIRLLDTEIVGARPQTLRQLRAQKMSMIFQDPATALNPYLRVGQQLKRVMLEHRHVSRKDAQRNCVELLDLVGLPDAEKQFFAYPHQLSGGMRQRVLIAAALIGEPDLIVADEPTTALDVTVQAQILKLLRKLQCERNTALLVITHDLGVIAHSCNRILVMDRGRLIEEGPCDRVLTNPAHPHTAELIAAAPSIDIPAPGLPASAETVLDVRQLAVDFSNFRNWRGGNGDRFVAVQPMDMTLRRGETLAIVGESGSGKTSLARSIAGLLPGCGGSVVLCGETLAPQVASRSQSTRRRLQMVFQDPVSSLNPSMCVDRIIAEPLKVHSTGLNAESMQKAVALMLERVGLEPALAERYPHELSGGQAQRVAIARALIVEPRVLICDEALAALDGTVRREILALLEAERERSNLSLILITHDLGVVREISDRVIVMYKGAVCETASNEELFANPQQDYTKALLAAVPTIPGRLDDSGS